MTKSANNDSYNKNNCPSCRELANGFNGQYTPEDLANACTVCSNDPMCGSGSTAYAYQTNPGSGAGGGTTGGSTTPASSGNPFGRGVIDVGGGSNSESQSLSSTSSSSTSSTMSGPLGVASGSGQAVVGANEYGIASAHGQSNFRIHSAIIQRSCEQGQMVGCGPLAGLSRGAGGASGTGGVR